MRQDTKPEEKRVFMKCRNPRCTSIEVVEIKYAPGTRLYRCPKCNHAVTVPVGGKVDLRSL